MSAPLEPRPRSAETVARYRASLKGTQRSALRLGTYALIFFWLAISMVITCVAATAPTSPDSLTAGETAVMILGFGIVVLAIAAAVHRLVMRDDRNLTMLVREGAAYPGRVAAHGRKGGLHLFSLEWDDGAGTHSAHVEIDQPAMQDTGPITIFALPSIAWVVAELYGGGVFLGKRT